MQRISALTIAAAPATSQSLLEATQKKIGMVPNLYATLAPSGCAMRSLRSIRSFVTMSHKITRLSDC